MKLFLLFDRRSGFNLSCGEVYNGSPNVLARFTMDLRIFWRDECSGEIYNGSPNVFVIVFPSRSHMDKAGQGNAFWTDVWIDGSALPYQHPMLFSMDIKKDCDNVSQFDFTLDRWRIQLCNCLLVNCITIIQSLLLSHFIIKPNMAG